MSPDSATVPLSVITSAASAQADFRPSALVWTLCGSVNLHQIYDAIESSCAAWTTAKIRQRWLLLNRARVSNPPDCPATRLRLGPRRDRVAKRPDAGRTTAWADVEGRHLLCGFVGRLQLRSPDLPRKACPHRAKPPFLFPNPSVQNRWGTKAEKWYPASQLGYCPT